MTFRAMRLAQTEQTLTIAATYPQRFTNLGHDPSPLTPGPRRAGGTCLHDTGASNSGTLSMTIRFVAGLMVSRPSVPTGLVPVTALAQPLLTTRALARPLDSFSTSCETMTGAALNALRVKQAAADAGCFETMIPRSSTSGFFLTPACTPVSAYPFGNAESGIGL